MANQKMTDRAGADFLRTLAKASEASREAAPRMTDADLADLERLGIEFIAVAKAESLARQYRLAGVEASPAAAH